MAGSVFDNPLFAKLYDPGEAARLFTPSAEIRAMLLVEGHLAEAQGTLGVIPETSAKAIARAAIEVQVDAAALAGPTGQNGVCVPGLVAAFRAAMQAPEHAQYVHWGATSQDIIDTGLMLRLRQSLALIEIETRALLATLADLAEAHDQLPMIARTWGQHATVTSFGAVAASWGAPLLQLLGELPALGRQSLLVSLSGAAGTGAALGPQAGATRTALARGLGLNDPGRSWHTDRGPLLCIAGWMQRLTAALSKIGKDVTAMTQSGVGLVRLGGAGASSTMPQKQNPVAAGAVEALAALVAGRMAALQALGGHRDARDGAAWMGEWMVLPELVLGTAAALTASRSLCTGLTPDAAAMADEIAAGGGLIFAEALSFALAGTMKRPAAQDAVKSLCREVASTGQPLAELAAAAHPGLDIATLFDPVAQLGTAPADAAGFAAAIRALAPQPTG